MESTPLTDEKTGITVNNEKPPVKTVKFSELHSLPPGGYLVKRSDDPNCIYKRLGNLEGGKNSGGWLEIFFNQPAPTLLSAIYSGASKKERALSLYQIGYAGFSNVTEIAIISEPTTIITGHKDGHHNQYILLHDSKNSFKIDFSYYQMGEQKLVKGEDGKFHVNMYGSNFELSSFLYHGRNSAPDLLCSLNALPGRKDLSKDSMDELLNQIKEGEFLNISNAPKLDGIGKTLANISQFYDPKENSMLRKASFILLLQNVTRAIDHVKVSVIFNKLFEGVKTKEAFDAKLDTFSDILYESIRTSNYVRNSDEYLKALIQSVPEARDIKKANIKKKSTGAFNKIMEDLEFVDIDETKYPLTHAAVHNGDIPLGTFFRKSEDTYFLFNDNWELWELMLKDYRETAIEIATEAAKRSQYEKDLMSYFYFTLVKLPAYLEEQTGKKWKGVPKMVTSTDVDNELDLPSGVTTKKRSALTPIADNEASTITVPYVTMKVSGGYGSTYTYGLNYEVLTKGLSFAGNVVMKDVEENLNGRDNYGLMFYTLTGSSQGRGYPTFLIIFEKRKEGEIYVHFHRVHPTRSKGGAYNPVHNWTVSCYKWMVGNVNFDRIVSQQGDLVFVKMLTPLDGNFQEVNAYDNHIFADKVKYLPYEKADKQNILGYFRLEKDTVLNHHEHLARVIPAGDYEVRQCRSWEANPKGIWSLRID